MIKRGIRLRSKRLACPFCRRWYKRGALILVCTRCWLDYYTAISVAAKRLKLGRCIVCLCKIPSGAGVEIDSGPGAPRLFCADSCRFQFHRESWYRKRAWAGRSVRDGAAVEMEELEISIYVRAVRAFVYECRNSPRTVFERIAAGLSNR